MPARYIPLSSGGLYHVFNRGITDQSTFIDAKDYSRARDSLTFYRSLRPPGRFSHFLRLPDSKKHEYLELLGKTKGQLVDLVAYCLMPNHFHFLVKQILDNGISTFTGQFTNSYTRYFNTRRHRIGPLFQGRFKAVHIESDEQLVHVSRYIHLNPYSSGIVHAVSDLKTYPYSSLPEYLEPSEAGVSQNGLVLDLFPHGDYWNFISDQADYQRGLASIKHITFE